MVDARIVGRAAEVVERRLVVGHGSGRTRVDHELLHAVENRAVEHLVEVGGQQRRQVVRIERPDLRLDQFHRFLGRHLSHVVDVGVDVEELAARLVVSEHGPRGRAVGRGVPADRRGVGGCRRARMSPLFELHCIVEVVDGHELTGILTVGAAHADALVARAVFVHVGLLVEPRLLHAEHRRLLVGEHRRNGLLAVVPSCSLRRRQSCNGY